MQATARECSSFVAGHHVSVERHIVGVLGFTTLLHDLADVTLPAPRLGPDLLLQTMRPKPHLDRLNEQVMHLHILIEGVTLQRLRSVRMEIQHNMGGSFFECAPPDPLDSPLW